jgi:hypothetical protein
LSLWPPSSAPRAYAVDDDPWAVADQARRHHNVGRHAIRAATTTTTTTTITTAIATPAALKRADSKAMFEVKQEWDVWEGVVTFEVAVSGTAAASRSRRRGRVAIPLQQHTV